MAGRVRFHTVDSDLVYRNRNGQVATIVGHITEADDAHDWEVLPMVRLRFDDGHELEAWADECKAVE